MSFIHNSALAGAGGQGGVYEIEQSLRFDGSGSKLVLASPTSSYTTNKFTMSCWVKMGPIASDFRMMARDGAPSNVENVWCSFNAFGNNVIVSYMYTASINGRQVLNTLGTQRDPSAWYHIVFGFDSSTGNTQRIWVNGVEQTTNKDTISGVAGFAWSSTYPFVIGGGTSHGYCAEYHFIDNTWLDSPDDFGELNDQGVWVPKEYTGSYGTNGFYLKFDPSATNGIGHDHSGTGNHLTASGFTTSGTGTDVMDDTPTTNWCTLNPLETGLTLSNGNLEYTYTSANKSVRGTVGVSSGKFRWEVKANGNNNSFDKFAGIIKANNSADNYDKNANEVRYNADAWGVANMYGGSTSVRPIHNNSFGTAFGWTWTTGDVLGLYFDATNGTLKANQNGGTLATVYTGLDTTATWLPLFSDGSVASSTDVVNFGQRAFEYSAAESGYLPLNTANLPAPTVKDGSDYFNTVTYSGDATGRTITGVGFQADFLWNKLRDTGSQDHLLYDTVRGIGSNGNYVRLRSNTATAEEDPATANQDLTAFTSDGFTIGTHAALNGNNQAYVTWLWKAGNGNSSIAAGSIDGTNPTIASTVSTNSSAGFSIVGYTGDGQNNATVGHGLGVTPRLCIGKSRAANSWYIRHESLGSNLNLNFNDQGTVAPGGGGLIGDLTSPTTISLPGGSNPGSGNMNANGTNYIMYCFAEVEGYSKVGSYIGNASTDGPFVYCGFRPAYIWLKGLFASNWNTYDSARSEFNAADDLLRLNSPAIEVPNYSLAAIDLLSNGFKIRTSSGDWNSSGQTFVFCAFAENPFGGSGVSPATAR